MHEIATKGGTGGGVRARLRIRGQMGQVLRAGRGRGARRWLPYALASLLGLAACGGGGGGGGSGEVTTQTTEGSGAAVAVAAYFPLNVGDRHYYAMDGGGQYSEQALGTAVVDGQTGIDLRLVDTRNGAITNSRQIIVVRGTDGTRTYPGAGVDPLDAAFGPQPSSLAQPFRIGQRYLREQSGVDIGQDYDGDGRSETATRRREDTVIGVDTITTPAGTFADCVHIGTVTTTTVTYSGGQPAQTQTVRSDAWYAAGVGEVRYAGTATAMRNGVVTATASRAYALTAWRVGDRRSDGSALNVLSTTPAASRAATGATELVVGFDKPVDRTATAAALTLLDPQGQAVRQSGQTFLADETEVHFRLGSALPPGRYQARLATTAQDRLGNPLAAEYVWSFDIDPVAPTLLSSDPADGATDVATTATLTLRFSEALDPASVKDSTVWLTGLGGSRVTARLAVASDTVTLTPAASLARQQAHTVNVLGVRDLAGNPVSVLVSSRFTTGPGRFAAPEDLAAGATPLAMVAGDFDGDGRQDVAISTGLSAPYRVLLRLQSADGSLGPAQFLDPAALPNCLLTSLVAGDLDGDGRTDLVVSGRNNLAPVVSATSCGTRVFRQGADGRLRAAESLSLPGPSLLRLFDLDGSGRLSLLGLGSAAVNVWRQGASGALERQPDIPLPAGPTWLDVAVADLNGDGRPDLVVLSSLGIAVLYRRADGSYPTDPVRLAITDSPRLGNLALGDFNGDGRIDVAVIGGIFLQRADGTLGAMTPLATAVNGSGLRASDINGDGLVDLVVGHDGWNQVGVYLQRPDGTLAAEVLYPAPRDALVPQAVDVADVTGDGRPDILSGGSLLRQRPVGVQAQSGPRAPDLGAALAGRGGWHGAGAR